MQFWKTVPVDDPVYAPSLHTISPGLVDESVFPHDVEHGDPGATSNATAAGAATATVVASRGRAFRILTLLVDVLPKSLVTSSTCGTCRNHHTADLTGRRS